MKRLFYLVVVLVFASCTGVYFNSPQPADGEKLNSVPVELQGKWIDKKDTCIITTKGMYQTEISKDSIGNEIVNWRWTTLSDSVLLFKSGKYYVVNMLDESGKGYMVVVVDIMNNGDINWYYPLESPFFGKRKGLEVDSVTRLCEEKNGEEKAMNRKKNRSLKNAKREYIETVYYSGKLNNDDLKKIMTSKNLFWILKKDGTAILPKNK